MESPAETAMPAAVPHAATAQRPDWAALPAAVRAWVEDQLGGPVLTSASQRSGYTPSFASRLRLRDGRRFFVKITDSTHSWLTESYRNEAAKRRTLPEAVPAPGLIDSVEQRTGDQTWLMLIFTDIDGRPPHRPWTEQDAAVAIRAVETAAQSLTPAPAGFDWLPLSEELGGPSPDKEQLITEEFGDHADELRELIMGLPDHCDGQTLVHADLRDDNMIIDTAGRAWICDWTFPLLGKPYVDLVTLSLSIRGDGLDADRMLASSPLVHPGDDDGIDSLLADLMLYYTIAARQPVPDISPHLRAHQRWNAAVARRWLFDRRGWTHASCSTTGA